MSLCRREGMSLDWVLEQREVGIDGGDGWMIWQLTVTTSCAETSVSHLLWDEVVGVLLPRGTPVPGSHLFVLHIGSSHWVIPFIHPIGSSHWVIPFVHAICSSHLSIPLDNLTGLSHLFIPLRHPTGLSYLLIPPIYSIWSSHWVTPFGMELNSAEPWLSLTLVFIRKIEANCLQIRRKYRKKKSKGMRWLIAGGSYTAKLCRCVVLKGRTVAKM